MSTAHEVLGNASQQEPPGSMPPMPSDHDEVSSFGIGQGDDRGQSLSRPQDVFASKHLATGTADERFEGFFAFGPGLIHAGMDAETVQTTGVEDIDDEEAGAKGERCLHGPHCGTFRGSRQIGRQHHGLDGA